MSKYTGYMPHYITQVSVNTVGTQGICHIYYQGHNINTVPRYTVCNFYPDIVSRYTVCNFPILNIKNKNNQVFGTMSTI